MFCPNCGAGSDSARFCRRCGTELGRVAEALQAHDESGQVVYRPSATRLGIFNTQVISNADSNVDGHAGLSVFGTVVADLSRRPLPYGETRISVSSVFGSIIVRVPEDVGVKVSGLSLFSTVKVRGLRIGDGFVEAQEYETPGYAQMGRRLRIDATVIFGTLKVKR